MIRMLVAIFLIGGAALTAAHFSGYEVFASPMLRVCEEALKDRLKAPSTYKRLSASELIQQLSFQEYFARSGDSDVVKQLLTKTATESPVRKSVVIDYEAGNSFGASIRSQALCTYDTLSRKEGPDSKMLVSIDGSTHTEWLAQQLTRATDKKRRN